jgi:hypothetical protein
MAKKPKREVLPSSLLHYTSLDVVKILLSNALKENRETLKFHASHLKMMNDLKEGSLILGPFFSDSNLKKELKVDWEKYISSHVPFVLSLIRTDPNSVNKGHIPMWRMYGANGSGAYLRFDYGTLEKYCNKNSLVLKKCDYSSSYDIRGKVKKLNENLKKELNANNKEDYFDGLLDISSFTKSIEWKYENEWRILIQRNQNTVLTKSTSRGIVEYTEVELPLMALEEICLGPLTSEDNLRATKIMCDKISQNTINVKKSNLKLRL